MAMCNLNFNIQLANKILATLLLSFMTCYAHASIVVTPLGDMSALRAWGFNTESDRMNMSVDQNVFDDWLTQAENGNAQYQYRIGLFYQASRLLNFGLFSLQNKTIKTQESIRWLEKSANQGIIKSHIYLGDAYHTLDDYESSFKHHKIAADYGSHFSQRMVAISYREGRGVEADIRKAILWFKMAAKQGDKDSEFALGKIYRDSGNTLEALKYFLNVANEEYGDHAFVEVGKLYLDDGDYDKAIYWLNRASREHSPLPADLVLGQMYFNGLGVEKNKQRACRMFENAASEPSVYYTAEHVNLLGEARYKLGIMYYSGDGCILNPDLGYAWLALSKSIGKEVNLEPFRRDVNISNALSLVQKCSDARKHCKLESP